MKRFTYKHINVYAAANIFITNISEKKKQKQNIMFVDNHNTSTVVNFFFFILFLLLFHFSCFLYAAGVILSSFDVVWHVEY